MEESQTSSETQQLTISRICRISQSGCMEIQPNFESDPNIKSYQIDFKKILMNHYVLLIFLKDLYKKVPCNLIFITLNTVIHY